MNQRENADRISNLITHQMQSLAASFWGHAISDIVAEENPDAPTLADAVNVIAGDHFRSGSAAL